jgi:tripartite-type tricarboxylate transporter receptor subunit TctC
MKLPRRKFLHLAAGVTALPAVSHIARAQAYPSRPVRFVVGFAPGGGGDLATRLMAQWLSDRLGQQFVVENRVGASSNLAIEQVVRAPADGYTLIQLNVANAINASLYDKLSFNVLRDLAPVASFMRVPNVMEVSPTPRPCSMMSADLRLPGKSAALRGGRRECGARLPAKSSDFPPGNRSNGR